VTSRSCRLKNEAKRRLGFRSEVPSLALVMSSLFAGDEVLPPAAELRAEPEKPHVPGRPLASSQTLLPGEDGCAPARLSTRDRHRPLTGSVPTRMSACDKLDAPAWLAVGARDLVSPEGDRIQGSASLRASRSRSPQVRPPSRRRVEPIGAA
jgi:hypothetical protein